MIHNRVFYLLLLVIVVLVCTPFETHSATCSYIKSQCETACNMMYGTSGIHCPGVAFKGCKAGCDAAYNTCKWRINDGDIIDKVDFNPPGADTLLHEALYREYEPTGSGSEDPL